MSNKLEDGPYFSISAKLIASSIPGMAFDKSDIKPSIPSVPTASSCSTVGSTSYKRPTMGSYTYYQDWNNLIAKKPKISNLPMYYNKYLGLHNWQSIDQIRACRTYEHKYII